MYIPEFVCGILVTIGVEIILLIGCMIFLKKQNVIFTREFIEFRRKKKMLDAIDKELNLYNKLYHKTKCQHYMLTPMINRYNAMYRDRITIERRK